MNVVGISGSLRRGSFNAALLRAAIEVAPEGCVIEHADIHGVPLYDGDVESTQGIPAAVRELKDRLARADGVLLVTPEYNGSIPGVLKNAIDWCSRPASDIERVFGGRPVGVIGATPGMGGTRLSQNAWLPIIRVLGMDPYFGKSLYVAGAGKVFDAEGALVDATIRRLLTDYVAGFAAFVSRSR
ncbi:NADPH-dependent FMN reductase [Sandaracinus amylolyticus]|uniref:NADPH quinone oxidoreductase n=1 Tax=Sandaracinus amylolyticus TaxID=927083 RepID=A0A0F6YGM5_9BACT|nr:NADPH-dependent FMN reductase [Sandaracinus amylolyticus]AKF03853.1 NADPH quinone oxidoreductase [Sandaracinus amylolyticus]